jgi:hypothetical protein
MVLVMGGDGVMDWAPTKYPLATCEYHGGVIVPTPKPQKLLPNKDHRRD